MANVNISDYLFGGRNKMGKSTKTKGSTLDDKPFDIMHGTMMNPKVLNPLPMHFPQFDGNWLNKVMKNMIQFSKSQETLTKELSQRLVKSVSPVDQYPLISQAIFVCCDLRSSSPYLFEAFCQSFLKIMGFVQREPGKKKSRDGGIDGLFTKTDGSLRTYRVGIQVKRYKSDYKVGSPDIDRFHGSLDNFFADYGIFITLSDFTGPAIADAYLGHIPVTLINFKALSQLLANERISYQSWRQFKDDYEIMKGEAILKRDKKFDKHLNLKEAD